MIQVKTAQRPCPVCGSQSVRHLHHQRFALPPEHPLPPAFEIVACPSCDFIYADTPAPAAAYDRYYSDYSKYSDQRTSTGGGGDPLDQARIEATSRAIASQLHNLDSFIIDIGCANGGMLATLRNKGYSRLLGVDPSPDCVANTTRLFGIPALQGWLGSMPPEAASADLAILSHVLEHVLDLSDTVRRLHSLLAPSGLLYVEVPDSSRYNDCLAAPFQDFNTEHINHFSPASLANLFTSQGFALESEGQKFLSIAGGSRYPACFVFFRRLPDSSTPIPWRRSPDALAAINAYIASSKNMLTRIDSILAALPTGPLIVWGAGQLTSKLLMETCLGSREIAAFTDGNPLYHGKTLHDRPIMAPDSLRELPPYPIVLGTLLHHDAIALRIRDELRLPNLVIILA